MSEMDIHKLTGAYAMDALDDLERARFEQHLATCEDCRAEVAELRETAALLSETVAVPPPAALRESVLAGISQVRPLAPEVTASCLGRWYQRRQAYQNAKTCRCERNLRTLHGSISVCQKERHPLGMRGQRSGP